MATTVIEESPGQVIIDPFIYKPNECYVHATKIQHMFGKQTVAGNSTQFNGQSMFNLGSQGIMGTVVLNASITIPAGANVAASSGWLFAAIQQVQVQYGASAGTTIQYDGHSVADYNFACSQHEIRDDLMWMGGEKINGGGIAGVDLLGKTYHAQIVLPVPWSTMGFGLNHKLPIDTSCMRGTVNVLVTFANASNFLTGSDCNTITEFSYLAAMCETYQGAPNEGFQNGMYSLVARGDPMAVVPYPYMQLQTAPIAVPNVFIGPGSAPTSVMVPSIPNSDLQLFIFTLVPESRIRNDMLNSHALGYYSVRLKSWALSYCGDFMMNVQNNAQRMVEAVNGGSRFDRIVYFPIPNATSAGPGYNNGLITTPCTFQKRRCPVYIWQSQMMREPSFEGTTFRTVRYSSSQFQLDFTPEDDEEPGPYRLYVTYVFTAVLAISGNGPQNINA